MKSGILNGLKIEKGIPIPQTYGEKGKFIDSLEVGDSVFFPGKTTRQVNALYYMIAKRHGIKVSIRREKDGARMWRVK